MKPPAFKPEYVSIPLKSGETEAVDGLVGVLYPHMMFVTLYHRSPDKFRDLFMNGKESNIPDFWEQMIDHPSFKDHPMHVHQLSNPRTHGLPIRLYGDGAAVGVWKTWVSMVGTIAWVSCLTTTGDSRTYLLVIAFMFELLEVRWP